MWNKLTGLSASVLVLTFALSSGAACARNILPDAFKDMDPNAPRNLPDVGYTYSQRISPIDDRDFGPVGRNDRFMRMAARLMSQAINAKNNGDLGKACRLANEATELVSRSASRSTIETDYAAFTAEVCSDGRNA